MSLTITYKLKETMNNRLKWLKNRNELCDVLLVSGQYRVAAHSCVLASYSPVLAAVLKARLALLNDWSILKPLIIIVDMEARQSHLKGEIEYSCLEMIISFLYGEEITVEESRIKELFNLSKLLGLSKHLFKTAESPAQKVKDKTNEKKVEKQDHDVIITVEERFSNAEDSLKQSKKQNYAPFNCKKKQEKNHLKLRTKHKILTLNNNNILKGNAKGIKSKYNFATKALRQHRSEDIVCKDEPRKLSILNVKTRSKIFSKKNQSQGSKRTTKSFACSVCKSSFSRANHLISHAKKENHYSQVCPLCFTQFDEYDDRKKHFSQHDHPSPFFCLCCDLRFRSRAGLAMHAPKHSDTKPYTCEECGRGFKWRHSAQAHAITHRNHCHLLCDICGFSSKYTSTFQSHLKRHYDQFFPCPHPGCNFKSFRKTHLNDHVATHAKLRPHQCEICGHSFSQAKNMRRHMRLHTADTNFLKCSVFSNLDCPYKTTRPDKLRIHLLQKHKMEHHDKITLPVDEGTSSASYRLELKDDSVQNSEKLSDFKSFDLENKDEEILSVLEESVLLERSSTFDNDLSMENCEAVSSLDRDPYQENVGNGAAFVSEKFELNQFNSSECLAIENIEILSDLSQNENENSTLELEIYPVDADSGEPIAKSGNIEEIAENLPLALREDKHPLLSKVSKQFNCSETDFVENTYDTLGINHDPVIAIKEDSQGHIHLSRLSFGLQ